MILIIAAFIYKGKKSSMLEHPQEQELNDKVPRGEEMITRVEEGTRGDAVMRHEPVQVNEREWHEYEEVDGGEGGMAVSDRTYTGVGAEGSDKDQYWKNIYIINDDNNAIPVKLMKMPPSPSGIAS